MSDDFVQRLVDGQLLSRMTELEAELAAERAKAADELQQLRDEIERLRAAGDKVAHTLSVQSEWTCCADGWFGPCGCPPDVATRPTDDSVATALAAWQEARRG